MLSYGARATTMWFRLCERTVLTSTKFLSFRSLQQTLRKQATWNRFDSHPSCMHASRKSASLIVGKSVCRIFLLSCFLDICMHACAGLLPCFASYELSCHCCARCSFRLSLVLQYIYPRGGKINQYVFVSHVPTDLARKTCYIYRSKM